MSLLLVAIAPSLALLLFIYTRDKYDREPLGLLLKLFILGALVCIPTAFAEQIIMLFGNGIYYTAFVVAGFTEEMAKFLIVYLFAYKSRHFNEKLDGIVYCAFVALGFATFENILYVTSNGVSVGVVRGLLSVPGHMLFGITMGYYLSLMKFAPTDFKWHLNRNKAILMPIILHGIYDTLALSRATFAFILLVIFAIFMWVINMKKLNVYVAESKENHRYDALLSFRNHEDE